MTESSDELQAFKKKNQAPRIKLFGDFPINQTTPWLACGCSSNHEEHRNLKSPMVDYGSIADHTFHQKLDNIRGSTIIEPVLLVYSVAQVLSETVMTNLLEYRTCKLQLSLPDHNCTEPISKPIENLIQPATSHIILSRSLMEAVVPACLALFVGPWSDVNGRKPFLVAAIGGSAITYLCCAGLVLMPNLSGYVFTVASLPLAVTGGPCTINMLIVCYITDVSNDHTRAFRLSMMSMAVFTSFLFGCASTKIVSTQLPFNPFCLVFTLSAFLLILCCLYTHLFIHEPVNVYAAREQQLTQFFNIKGLFTSCFHRKNGYARIMIILIIIIFMLNVFLAKGEITVSYLATREMFSWQLSDFTMYSIFTSSVYGLGVLSGVWLFNTVLGIPDIPLAALLLASRCVRCVIMACSTSGIYFYVGVIVSTFYASYTPLCCSEICRLVAKEDLGKVFALSAFVDNISPIVSSTAYTFVYQATYLSFPGSIYWLGAGITGLSVLLLLVVIVLQKMSKGSCYTASSIKQIVIKE